MEITSSNVLELYSISCLLEEKVISISKILAPKFHVLLDFWINESTVIVYYSRSWFSLEEDPAEELELSFPLEYLYSSLEEIQIFLTLVRD